MGWKDTNKQPTMRKPTLYIFMALSANIWCCSGAAQLVQHWIEKLCATDTSLTPWCGKGFLAHSHDSEHSVQTLSLSTLFVKMTPSPYQVNQHPCTHSTSQAMAAMPFFEHTKIVHTLVRIGSAALAASVAWPLTLCYDQNFPQGIKEILSWLSLRKTNLLQNQYCCLVLQAH